MQHGSSDLICFLKVTRPRKHNCHQAMICTQLQVLTWTACFVLVWLEEAGQGKAHTPILHIQSEGGEERGHVRREQEKRLDGIWLVRFMITNTFQCATRI